MNEREHAKAWRTLIGGNLGSGGAYDYDDAPAALPGVYVLVTVSRRYAEPAYASGLRGTTPVRLTTLAVGRTVDEARWARQRVAAVVDESQTTVDGLVTTPVQFETETPIEPDDGRYSGLTAWTYTV